MTVVANQERIDVANVTASDSVGSLVYAASRGQQWAWARLVDRFGSAVSAIARAHRLSNADASDVAQTTWMRLLENIDRIEQPDQVGAWLATTAKRESWRLVRLANRQVLNGQDLETIAGESTHALPERTATLEEHHQLIADLILRLPPRWQMLLRLLSADVPYKQISDTLDMPIGSIGPTRARALEQLRRLAVRAGIDPDDCAP